VEKRRGCCGVRGVYHNIKCGQEEGKKANTPFIKKTCYSSLHCLITNDYKQYFLNTFTTQAFTYLYNYRLAPISTNSVSTVSVTHG
jgi:hypothetical protein